MLDLIPNADKYILIGFGMYTVVVLVGIEVTNRVMKRRKDKKRGG